MRSICPYLFLLAAVSFSALANPTPTDPEILIDIGCCSPSINMINNAQPNATGTTTCPPGFTGQCFDFMNDTSGVVTSLTFQTMVNAGLREQIANVDGQGGVFSCQQGAGNEYFLGCMAQYTDSTGALRYTFQGVNPPDGDEINPGPFCPEDSPPGSCDSENGEMEGIPIGGHFLIGLGGYVAGATAVGNNETNVLLFGTPDDPNRLPIFDNGFTVPEPSQLLLLAVECLLLVSIAGIIRRRTKRKENSPTV